MLEGYYPTHCLSFLYYISGRTAYTFLCKQTDAAYLFFLKVTKKYIVELNFTKYFSILISKQKILKLYEVAENNALTLFVIIFAFVHLFS